ncbi:11188_t:CDS:2, partial [Cetraspora pellucida]
MPVAVVVFVIVAAVVFVIIAAIVLAVVAAVVVFVDVIATSELDRKRLFSLLLNISKPEFNTDYLIKEENPREEKKKRKVKCKQNKEEANVKKDNKRKKTDIATRRSLQDATTDQEQNNLINYLAKQHIIKKQNDLINQSVEQCTTDLDTDTEVLLQKEFESESEIENSIEESITAKLA